MNWELEIKDSEFIPQKRNPTEETFCYKIGGIYYEMSTSCGGSERLRDKMVQAIKRAQGRAGEHLTKPPYGYKVSPTDKKQ